MSANQDPILKQIPINEIKIDVSIGCREILYIPVVTALSIGVFIKLIMAIIWMRLPISKIDIPI